MKTMKMFTVALAALTMFSCSKDNGVENDEPTALSVKIASNQLDTKAGPSNPVGAAYNTPVENGVIFICNADNTVAKAVAIVKADINNNGQVIDNVLTTQIVYVVANIPAQTVTDWTTSSPPANIDAINASAFEAAIDAANSTTNVNGTDYEKATLANSSKAGQKITRGSGKTATVSVAISPVYSRLEISKITAKDESTTPENQVTAFTVEGVYVDGYYNKYTVGGDKNGDIFDNGTTTPVRSALDMRIEQDFVATSSSAIPGTNKVWGFNVPSSTAPRIIIKLKDVAGKQNNVDLSGKELFLTVVGYKNLVGAIPNFARGNVYRINELQFSAKDLAPTPNTADVSLTVTVDIAKWIVNEVEGEF